MTDPIVVIVFGVSCVGKTTACTSFIQKRPEFSHLRASDLLNKGDRLVLGARTEHQVLGDQLILAHAFQRSRAELSTQSIIFDAHSVIRGAGGILTVPTVIISEFQPDLLIFLEANPQTIINRRITRDKMSLCLDPQGVSEEQDMARQAVEMYSTELNVPLKLVDANQHVSLTGIIPQV